MKTWSTMDRVGRNKRYAKGQNELERYKIRRKGTCNIEIVCYMLVVLPYVNVTLLDCYCIASVV